MKQSFFARYKVWIIAVCVALIGIALYIVLKNYLTIRSLQQPDNYFQNLIDHNYVGAVLIYITLYVCIIATSLPLIAPLAIAGGFLFGILEGFLYAEVGTTVGAVTAFLMIRAFSTTGTLQSYRKKLHKLESQIKKNGVGYLLLLSLLSVVPFFVINMVAVLADVSFITVAWTTAVGSIPLLFLYVLAGFQLRTIGSVKDIFSPQLIVVLVLLGIFLFVLPKFITKLKHIAD
jgi:uncharacterized membrane protein YdjX (TVP38/TMEM64 family)